VFRRRAEEVEASRECFFCGQETSSDEETEGGLAFMTLISAVEGDQKMGAWACHAACALKARHNSAQWIKTLDVNDLRQ
jgi:hypothetical protein